MKTGHKRPIRVLVADDHPVVRGGIQMILADEPGIELVAEAADGREAIAKTVELTPDVVIMDLVMPRLDGIGAAREITRRCPGTMIILFTAFGSQEENALIASYAGAVGAISKLTTENNLVEAIKDAYRTRSGAGTWPEQGDQYHGKRPNQTSYLRA